MKKRLCVYTGERERAREKGRGGGVVSKEWTYAIIYKYVGQDDYWNLAHIYQKGDG